MKRRNPKLTRTVACALLSLLIAAPQSCQAKQRKTRRAAAVAVRDSVAKKPAANHHHEAAGHIERLTEQDYREVAERLGIEVATIKAVVEIEAGPSHEGFFKPGLPLINFDMSMFKKFAGRKGLDLSRYYKSHAVVFSRPNAARYGSTQAGQQERLRVARTIDDAVAVKGCFWGMFQIGGFNWKKCGCESIEEFVERMSRSEREQLELFADFVINSNMLPALKAKNWSSFARAYNGTSALKRGYHTRLANSYARHKKNSR